MVHHSDGPYGHRTIQFGDGALNAHPLTESDLPAIGTTNRSTIRSRLRNAILRGRSSKALGPLCTPPADAYAPFFSRNLVSCCSTCNVQKGAMVIDDATNIRLVLHPYFDFAPEERIQRTFKERSDAAPEEQI